jgi:hypothetical protein
MHDIPNDLQERNGNRSMQEDTKLNSDIIHSTYINLAHPWICQIVNPCTHSYWDPTSIQQSF